MHRCHTFVYETHWNEFFMVSIDLVALFKFSGNTSYTKLPNCHSRFYNFLMAVNYINKNRPYMQGKHNKGIIMYILI